MKPQIHGAVIALALLASLHDAVAQSTAFTYQGRLTAGTNVANGNYDLKFSLYDAASSGTQLGGPLTNAAVAVSNGLFTATLNFGAGAFTGADRWLEISARTNGSGGFTPLSPRQPLTPTPYALWAGSLSSNANQTFAGTVSFSPASGPPFEVGSALKVVNLNADLLDGFDSTAFWKLSGNAGTSAGVNFLGTTDNQALELKVNAQRAFRLEPTTNTPNLIGGFAGNYVGSNVFGTTIGGGGGNSMTNLVDAATWGLNGSIPASFGTLGGGAGNSIAGSDFSTISGGRNNSISTASNSYKDQNTIGGGAGNSIYNARDSVIAGGETNIISGDRPNPLHHSTIGGGWGNKITDGCDEGSGGGTISGGYDNWIHGGFFAPTIGGGRGNTINCQSDSSTIGGGMSNRISYVSRWATIGGGGNNFIDEYACGAAIGGGASNQVLYGAGASPGNVVSYATIPGGLRNTATNFAFAAARRAKAITEGAFVWADSTDADFPSTAANQFLIRATGGVGIGSTNPIAQLDVRGKASFSGAPFIPSNPALNIISLQVGTNVNGGANGITFGEDEGGFGMKLGYDGSGMGTENKLAIYDVNNSPQFVFESGGNLGLGVNNPGYPIEHSSGARLTAGGVWQNASDANRKMDFRQVNPQEVLAMLAHLPVQSWRYTNEVSNVRHLGPTAQDFKAAFDLGTDDKSIGTLDADGVAMAAIQGLNQILQEKEARISALEKTVAELKALMIRSEPHASAAPR
jgi:trimeric autotransporter adhesin